MRVILTKNVRGVEKATKNPLKLMIHSASEKGVGFSGKPKAWRCSAKQGTTDESCSQMLFSLVV